MKINISENNLNLLKIGAKFANSSVEDLVSKIIEDALGDIMSGGTNVAAKEVVTDQPSNGTYVRRNKFQFEVDKKKVLEEISKRKNGMTIKTLSNSLSVDYNKVRRSLLALIEDGAIVRSKNKKGSHQYKSV
jgi:hypothetical protein